MHLTWPDIHKSIGQRTHRVLMLPMCTQQTTQGWCVMCGALWGAGRLVMATGLMAASRADQHVGAYAVFVGGPSAATLCCSYVGFCVRL